MYASKQEAIRLLAVALPFSESCSKILLAHYLWRCPLEAPIQSRYDAVRNAVHP